MTRSFKKWHEVERRPNDDILCHQPASTDPVVCDYRLRTKAHVVLTDPMHLDSVGSANLLAVSQRTIR